MTFLLDTGELRSRARRIDDAAANVRSQSSQLQAAADNAQWVSLAGSRFHAQAASVRVRLDSTAHSLEHAARLLRAHADTVDRRVHEIAGAAEALAHDAERVGAEVFGTGKTVWDLTVGRL